MAKKTLELDTPFRRGEKVIATRDLGAIPGGTKGKVQLRNGLGTWNRYWVLFDGGHQVGQVDHDDLTRPHQLAQWTERKEAEADAALRAEQQAEVAAESDAAGGGDAGGNGIASQIPAHLLERSRDAKARLLGA